MYKTVLLTVILLLDIVSVSRRCVGAECLVADPINLACCSKTSTQEITNDSQKIIYDCYCDQNKEHQQRYNITISPICVTSTTYVSVSTTLLRCTPLPASLTTSNHTLDSLYYIIAIVALGFTNILLVIIVFLCSIALCFVKQRTARLYRHTTEVEMLKIVNNPTYEERDADHDQETSNREQPQTEISSQYSTLGPMYDSIKNGNLRVLMLPETSTRKKGKRPQRHTEPARYTRRNYDIDDHGYSRLVQH